MLNALDGLKRLTYSVLEMNGVFVAVFGLIGAFAAATQYIRKKAIQKIPLLLLFGPALFLAATTVKGNVPLIVPEFNFYSIFDEDFILESEYNMRYGIQFLPLLIVLFGYLAYKLKSLSYVLLALILIQFFSSFSPYNLVFALQKRPPHNATAEYRAPIDWFNENYDDGKILVSVLANDATIFFIDVPYKTFIFEGNGDYWKESLEDPTKYAKWVIMKKSEQGENIEAFSDRVAFHLKGQPVLTENYDLVYDKSLLIYKLRGEPKVQLP
ncbi:hypothetical protein HY469_06185 [Candidatus Roizmanbacteria bacterium]|nr:hypothetical protein [Candidatus Roizmanbacteria bacterium]